MSTMEKIMHRSQNISEACVNYIQMHEKYLPFYVLMVSYVVRVIMYVIRVPAYWGDEVFLNSTVPLSLQEILEVYSYELYPPGHFLLAKLLPLTDVLMTRITAVSVLYAGVCAALFYAHSTSLLAQRWLAYGLAMFLTSFSFLLVTLDMRVELFTSPFALLFYLVVVQILTTKQINKRELVLLYGSMITVLCISYSAYAFLGISLAFVSLIVRRRSIVILLFVQMGVVALLWNLLIGMQYINYHERLIAKGYQYNSIFHSLKYHLTGYLTPSFLSDMPAILFLILLVWSFYVKRKSASLTLFRSMVVLSVILILFAYFTRLLPQVRHVYVLYIPVSILVGFGLAGIRTLALRILLVSFFLFTGLVSHQHRNRIFSSYLREMVELTQRVVQQSDEATGFVSDYSLVPYLLKMDSFRNEERFRPVSINTKLDLDETMLTREHLRSDYSMQRSDRRDRETVRKILKGKQLSQYIFYEVRPIEHLNFSHFDAKRTIFHVLIEQCKLEDILHSKDSTLQLLFFDGCSFDVVEKT